MFPSPSQVPAIALPNAQPFGAGLPEAERWVFVVSIALSLTQVPRLPGLLTSPRPEWWVLPSGLQNGSLYREPALPLAMHDTQKMEWLPWEIPAMLLSGRLGPLALGLRLGSMAVCLWVPMWAGRGGTLARLLPSITTRPGP